MAGLKKFDFHLCNNGIYISFELLSRLSSCNNFFLLWTISSSSIRCHTISCIRAVGLNNMAIASRSRVSCAHTVTAVTFQGGGGSRGGSIWDTGGGRRCRKHKFQCGIVFHGRYFHEGETFVTPLVAAATRPRRPLRNRFAIKSRSYVPYAPDFDGISHSYYGLPYTICMAGHIVTMRKRGSAAKLPQNSTEGDETQ